MNNISADQLRRAADIQDKIESLNAELESILGGQETRNGAKRLGRPPKTGGDVARYKAARADKPKRKMSAEGRAKIAAAARARWAKVKAKGGNSL